MSSRRRWLQLGSLSERVDWEIEHHLTERIEELMEQGSTREEAEREARRAFGNVADVRRSMRSESAQRERRTSLRAQLDAVQVDARHALRRLGRNRGYAIVAILVLGIGIGANTAIFSALRHTLLSGSPYAESDRLMLVDLLSVPRAGAEPADTMPWSYPKFLDMRAQLEPVASIAGYNSATMTLTGLGAAARIGIEYVTPAYFPVLRLEPSAGGAFSPGHDSPDAGAFAVLAHHTWMTRFGGAPSVIGSTITLNGAPVEVIGVAPEGFRGLTGMADAFVNVTGIAAISGPRRLELRQAHWMRAVARLDDDATLTQARDHARRAGLALTGNFTAASDDAAHAVSLVPLDEARVNSVTRLAVSAVGVAAALLLLIACANIASLMVARTNARRSELALRSAIGASRGRLIRGCLMEAMVIAVAGGALGVMLAWLGRPLVAAAMTFALDTTGTRELQFLDPGAVTLEMTVLLACLGLTLLTGLTAGLLPAWTAGRTDVTRDLRSGARSAVNGAAAELSFGGRGVLVAAQLALTLVLLAGTGLMAASFLHLTTIPTGFTHENVLIAGFDRGPGATPEEDIAFERALLERVHALPGVQSASVGLCAPLTRPCEIAGILRVDDQPEAEELKPILAYAVDGAYFETLGIRMIAGRTFDAATAAGDPVVVINESAARDLFGGSAIGRRIMITHTLTETEMATVIGVAADVQYSSPEEPLMHTLYYHRAQEPTSYGTLFVRTAGDPLQAAAGVQRIMQEVAPAVPLVDVSSMRSLRLQATARTRTFLWLLGAFAAAGLLLSALGLYGMVTHAVSLRTREVGVRIALGATSSGILRLMVRSPVAISVIGAAGGLAVALFATRYAQALLFGVQPGDPRVLGGAVVALLAVACAAAIIPALRALRIDPADALRAE